MSDIVESKWYNDLVEECRGIITEAVFTSRWALVEGYWNLGKRIREDVNFQKAKEGNKNLMQGLAVDLKQSERTIYYAIQCFDTYSDIQKLPEGKNITWNKLITKYLPKPKENIIELPVPDDKYNVIVIDPPWAYGTEYNNETRRVASPYQELSFDELSKLELPSADNCILWLWTTHKFIWEAKELMDIWGFEYKLILVWDKEKLGMGSWLRCQTEFCLLGIRGNMTADEIVSFLEGRLKKAQSGSETFEKDTLIYAHGFKDGEIFAYKVVLAFINNKEEI